MNPQAGLAFEQAPPFSLPLRFFLTAPLFLLAAAILILLSPEALTSRWTPQALALTHLLTLGFLAMTMLGALMQMLPVVAGATLPAAQLVAWFSHVPLTLGTLALVTGFLTAEPAAYGIGLVLLTGGFATFILAASISLTRAVSGVTVVGIRFAMACLAITILLGLTLALLRTGWWNPEVAEAVLSTHAVFGLLGWVGLLIMSVAYQVVPMFQITPPYPPLLSRWLVAAMCLLLLLHTAATLFFPAARYLIDTALASGMLVFALTTLHLISQRRRKLPDVTLNFWRLGMASLVGCTLVWLPAQFYPPWGTHNTYPLLLGVLFVGGFSVSVVNGMLYKIVPFLAWFHLQAQLQAKAGSIPTMKDMIPGRWMHWQFRAHVCACVLLIAATFKPLAFALPAGITIGLSALLLWVNLLSAVRRYRRQGGILT